MQADTMTLFFDGLFLTSPLFFVFLGFVFWMGMDELPGVAVSWFIALRLFLLVIQSVHEMGWFPASGY